MRRGSSSALRTGRVLDFARDFVLGLAMLFMLANGALAGTASPVADDPLLEKRVLALSEQLRCLVCQNQTIADSHADLAIDLRNQVREKMQAGWSDAQVLEFMVQRYGDFVLYKPPVKSITWLLWFGPFLLFFGALALLLIKLKRQRQQDEPSAAELQRAAHLLGGSAGAADAGPSGTNASGSSRGSTTGGTPGSTSGSTPGSTPGSNKESA
jgi:cytochrome c-type biogenesis protein CcmH